MDQTTKRKRVGQIRFEWVEESEGSGPCEVVLDRETTKTVLDLMVRALVAVAHAAEEVADER